MTEKEETIIKEQLLKYLQKEGPQKEGDCTLIHDTFRYGDYYLVTAHEIVNGKLIYTINDRFWYDFVKTFAEEGRNWKVIYKNIK